MRRLMFITAFGACLAIAPAAFAMTDAECAAAWKTADVNADGVLTDAEAARYIAALRVAGKPVADGKIPQALFLQHCRVDLFKVGQAEPGAPLAGANSFTENQAIDRIIAAGLSNVSGLKKDENGVWRGMASDGTKTVSVALDFKGNVVIQ